MRRIVPGPFRSDMAITPTGAPRSSSRAITRSTGRNDRANVAPLSGDMTLASDGSWPGVTAVDTLSFPLSQGGVAERSEVGEGFCTDPHPPRFTRGLFPEGEGKGRLRVEVA